MVSSKSAWQVPLPKFPKLDRDLKCDVLIVGGGITGLTAGYLLTRAGRQVCVIERDTIGSGDTYCTTAHLTYVTDLRLKKLASTFGKQAAELVWRGGAAAIDVIEDIVQREGIDCNFRRVPGYLHAPLEGGGKEQRALRADCELAQELGFEAAFVNSAPLVGCPAVRFANVAKFHPLQYLSGLTSAAVAGGCKIYERSEATEFLADPIRVKANKRTVSCDYIVLATHVPLMGKTGLVNATLLQSKLAPYSSYVISAKIPRNKYPEACFWDTADPYHYLRIDEIDGKSFAIFGGEDHKTGQADDMEQRYSNLTEKLLQIIPEARVERRWSGQVVETNDGLPYIGETAERQFTATGFGGNGFTFGTLAALMACDAAAGHDNPWQKLLSVNRKKLRGGTWDYLTENIDYPYYMARDWLRAAEAKSPRDVKPGEGKILNVNGQRVACSRSTDGKVSSVSAICTHMGCIVHWNGTEQTWDCPCHGSRFEPNGKVIAGPAETPLEKVKPTSSQTQRKSPTKPAANKAARSG